MYFKTQNLVFDIIILLIILVAGFWAIALMAAYIPTPIDLLLKILVVAYVVFGVINSVRANRNV